MDILNTLLRKVGAETAPRSTKAGKLLANQGVTEGPELLRIRALPRRRWQDDPHLEDLVEEQTKRFRRPNAEDPNARLLTVQAVALAEFEIYGRLTAIMGVGPQPVDEPVLTPNGWRPIGQLKPGDFVIGSDGQSVRVTAVHDRGVQRTYKVHISDGTYTRSSENHLWTFRDSKDLLVTKTLSEWLTVSLRRKCGPNMARKFWLPELAPVQGRFTDRDLPLDPYTLGALIGDGSTSQQFVTFTTADNELLDQLKLPADVELFDCGHGNSGRAKTYRVRKKTGKRGPKFNSVLEALRKLGCMKRRAEQKKVPDVYKYNTPDNRLAFLQGLFDTDGYASGRLCDYTTSSPELADDVCEMVESLGGSAKLSVKETALNGQEMLPAFRISVQLPSTMNLFRLRRKTGSDATKRNRSSAQRQRVLRAVDRFEYVGDFPSVCIEVDAADHLYVTRHHILTHNSGKTIITALLPTVMHAARPLLIVPANLVEKTRKEFKKLSKTWLVHPGITIVSYEKISGQNYTTFLAKGRYDLVMCDESYMIKTPDAGRTAKIGDYMTSSAGVVFVPLTGTPGDSTINDYAHYFYWANGESSPLPKPGTWELLQWCQATDETTRELRRPPGALTQFSGGSTVLDDVRAGIGMRLEETPGVVYWRDAEVNCSLACDAWVHDSYSDTVEKVFAHVRETGDELPDGRVLDLLPEGVERSALETYNLFATMNLGFVRVIDPPPPPEWRSRRKAWNKHVNDCLADDMGFYTPGDVKHAAVTGELDTGGLWEAWAEIEPTFKPVSKTEWFSDEIVQLVAEWMQKHDALVWVPFPAFGRALARVSKRPFFHHQGRSLTHGSIEEYTGTDSVILSTQSNFVGRNLQDRWSNNLIISSSAKADVLEQQIGRTHRLGQHADVVNATFFVGSIENAEALDRARRRARIDSQLGRNKKSKVLICDWLVPDLEEFLKRKGPRWRKK